MAVRRVNVFSASVLLVSFFLVSCYSGGPHQPLIPLGGDKSTVGEPGNPPVEGGLVRYADVRPIFEVRCSRCHPAWSPPNWLNYNEASAYMQNGKLANRALGDMPTMPMIGSPEAEAITDEERALLKSWIDDGGLE